jgi:hypothetical protein
VGECGEPRSLVTRVTGVGQVVAGGKASSFTRRRVRLSKHAIRPLEVAARARKVQMRQRQVVVLHQGLEPRVRPLWVSNLMKSRTVGYVREVRQGLERGRRLGENAIQRFFKVVHRGPHSVMRGLVPISLVSGRGIGKEVGVFSVDVLNGGIRHEQARDPRVRIGVQVFRELRDPSDPSGDIRSSREVASVWSEERLVQVQS